MQKPNWFKVWLLIIQIWYSLSRLQKPFPSFVRLIPAQYAYWNAVKGGSDTTTKLMDDCILRIPKAHLDPETVAITRLIAIVIVLFHRLSQIFSSNQNINTYPSLAHYHNAASHWATYHKSLLKVRKIFVNELKAITTDLGEEPSTHQPPNHQLMKIFTCYKLRFKKNSCHNHAHLRLSRCLKFNPAKNSMRSILLFKFGIVHSFKTR